MTFWLDGHFHPELADWLGSQFKVIVKTLREVGLHEAKDPVLYDAARRYGNVVIITKDADFAEMVDRLGSPPQIVWVTTGNSTKLELQTYFRSAFSEVLERLEAGAPIVEISR